MPVAKRVTVAILVAPVGKSPPAVDVGPLVAQWRDLGWVIQWEDVPARGPHQGRMRRCVAVSENPDDAR